MALDSQACPRASQPAALTEQNCEINWKNFRRIVSVHADSNLFTNAGSAFGAADAATQVTDFTAQANWTTALAIAQTDINHLFISGRARGSELTPGDAQIETREDNSQILTDISPSSLAMKFYGLDGPQEDALKDAFNGTGYLVGLMLADGKVLGYDAENANVPGTDGVKNLFFPVQTGYVQDRSAGNNRSDFTTVTLVFEYNILKYWRIYDTSAFGTTI